MQQAGVTSYETNQSFNALVSWLHSVRYKNVIGVVDKIARVKRGNRITVIDIGCAHAKLFAVLKDRFEIDYTGIEIDPVYAEVARSRYAEHPHFRIIQDSVMNCATQLGGADIIIALETCEHIPERDVVRIIEAVSEARPGVFICSVPVELGPSIWIKNFGSLIFGYMRHTEYRWSETFWAGLYQLDRLPPHGTGHKGFDWRWLAQTIRHNMQVIEVRKFPFGILPAALAFSVFMVAKPRHSGGNRVDSNAVRKVGSAIHSSDTISRASVP